MLAAADPIGTVGPSIGLRCLHNSGKRAEAERTPVTGPAALCAGCGSSNPDPNGRFCWSCGKALGESTRSASLAAEDGTGDIDNLIREGTNYPGGPTTFAVNVAQATTTSPTSETGWIAEAMWADGSPTTDSDALLVQACRSALNTFAA
jgi:hypothetical protein